MESTLPIYKFTTLRNPSDVENENSGVELIFPSTTFVDSLIAINEGSGTNTEKLDAFNTALQTYIDSTDFVKTKVEFDALKTAQDASPTQDAIDLLYNNVVVRTLTKSSTNLLFKKVVDQLKFIYEEVNSTGASEFQILISNRLAFTFADFESTAPDPEVIDETEQEEILAALNDLLALESLLGEAVEENVVSFQPGGVEVENLEYSLINTVLKSSSLSVIDAEIQIDGILADLETEGEEVKSFNRSFEKSGVKDTINDAVDASPEGFIETVGKYSELKALIEKAKDEGLADITSTKSVETEKYIDLYNRIKIPGATMSEVQKALKTDMEALSKKFGKLAPEKEYSLIGDNWVETSEFPSHHSNSSGSPSIITYPTDCNLKAPFQIADLRVVEQQAVGYLPGEIAHINNTQRGEKNTRVTRRLKKVESFESIITDDEVFHETDTQSTEKFAIETEARNVQASANSFNINASVSGSYGPISATVDTGYSNSNSTTNSNSISQNEAREVVKTIVDRVSNRIRTERSTKTIEEFEETVTHEIDNTGEETKSYVYRWLNKLIRATLKNYGKRLIFQFDIAHPAHYYLSRAIKDMPTLNVPPDPRELSVNGQNVLSIDNITRDNYLAWGAIYKTELDQPPIEKIIVSEVLNGTERTVTGKLIPIEQDYKCYNAKVVSTYHNGWPYHNYIVFALGTKVFAFWNGGDTFWSPATLWLSGETKQLPVSISTGNQGFIVNIEIECHLTDEAYHAWKVKTYNAIVAAYEKLKADAESELASFNPNLPGLHPFKKSQVIKDEIKKETIRKMFRCNPFWINDKYVVGNEYDPDCCLDSLNAERVRFIESVFDWKNLTYEFHPYFYADKDNWSQLLDLSDDDPHFESFLRASFATVRVPVHRDHLKEVAAINFLQNNSIANYEVIPEDMQPIIDELIDNEPTQFTYDLDGNELAEPSEVVDLGVFHLPTSLVILECGVSDGVKPIGFPESTDEPTSDVIIPKQYSPAIIADSCEPPTP